MSKMNFSFNSFGVISFISTGKMVAAYDKANHVVHIYYGAQFADVATHDEAMQIAEQLKLGGVSALQFESLVSYYAKLGQTSLTKEMVSYGKNMGLSTAEVAQIWVKAAFKE